VITENDMYWLTRLDHIRGVLAGLTGIVFFLGFCGTLAGALFGFDIHSSAETRRRGRRFLISGCALFVLALTCTLVRTFVPTMREMCAIKVIPLVANNEDVQALGAEIPKLAREWLQELKPEAAPNERP